MTPRIRTAVAVCALTLSAFPSGASAQDRPSPCAGQESVCADVGVFTARITDFRTSTQSYYKIMTVTVRFENRSTREIRLAYLAGSGVSTDDQGNRYVVYGDNAVRGIGQVTNNQVDPKFALAPGESSDARFELMWRPARTTDIVGTVFDVVFAVREIEDLPANQYRLGREHALSFRSLQSGTVTLASAAAQATPTETTQSSGAVEQPPTDPPKPRGILGVLSAAAKAKLAIDQAKTGSDGASTASNSATESPACAGVARCHDAGPFTTQVTSITGSRIGGALGDHMLRITMRIRNTGTQPLILAYTARSSLVTDELGNRYYSARPGTHDVSATGIGVAASNRVDPQFQLAPGQARNVTFEVRRFRTGREALGTRFVHEVALEQLELLNGGAVRSIRQHSISTPNLTP